MKVRQLIEQLQAVNPEAVVIVIDTKSEIYRRVTEVNETRGGREVELGYDELFPDRRLATRSTALAARRPPTK